MNERYLTMITRRIPEVVELGLDERPVLMRQYKDPQKLSEELTKVIAKIEKEENRQALVLGFIDFDLKNNTSSTRLDCDVDIIILETRVMSPVKTGSGYSFTADDEAPRSTVAGRMSICILGLFRSIVWLLGRK